MQSINYSSYQFTLFRIGLGVYLLIHFAMLIPYASELFSSQGMLPNPMLNPTHIIFPNVLNWLHTPAETMGFMGALTVLALLFTCGINRRLVALLLWYGWACLLNRNVFILNPGIPYVGWLLLASALIPNGEPLSLSPLRSSGSNPPSNPNSASDSNSTAGTQFSLDSNLASASWKMPTLLIWGAWLLMAGGYTVSGLHKLGSPSWLDGSAMQHLLENPLARDWWFREFLLGLPYELLQGLTWSVLALEVGFLLFCFHSQTRKWAWFAMVGMHIGILLVIDFADLTFGLLMLHLFTFDARWLGASSKQNQTDDSAVPKARLNPLRPIVFFDGDCAACNRWVQFVVQEDQSQRFQFAPLQGETAQSYLRNAKNLNSIVVVDTMGQHQQSDAILQILIGLGGIWRLAMAFLIIPRRFRNEAYDFFSRHRYKWFRSSTRCALLSAEARQRILP